MVMVQICQTVLLSFFVCVALNLKIQSQGRLFHFPLYVNFKCIAPVEGPQLVFTLSPFLPCCSLIGLSVFFFY